MRKYYLLFGLLGVGMMCHARHLTPSEALQRVTSLAAPAHVGGAVAASPRLVHEVRSEISGRDASVYVFSGTGGSGGFLVLSADDDVTPVLGYSDAGDIDSCELPENMRWWLDEMGRQVDYAVKSGLPQREPVSVGPAIAPLVKATWGQKDPYNLYTPVVDEKQSPTGCVATALCQIMYSHRWPVSPVGSHSYTKNDVEYSIDYSGMTFDWDAMTDFYDETSTQRSREAVATLMKAVGYGVDMSYGAGSSGATNSSVEKAMKTYFGYSDDYEVVQRAMFTDSEWDEMFYQMLSSGMPLFQTGRDGMWVLGTVGHAFVCDGYDGNGYYHYNWGWDGKYNGYFLLSCLVPEGVGTGGSAGGYNYRQEVFVNLHPDNGKAYDNYKYLIGRDFVFDTEGTSVKISLNSHCGIKSAQFGVALRREGAADDVTPLGDVTVGGEAAEHSLPDGWFDALDKTMAYEVRLVWRENLDAAWTRVLPAMKDGWIQLTQEPVPVGGVLSYVDGKWQFDVTDVDEPDLSLQVDKLGFKYGNLIVLGMQNEYAVNVTNPSDTHYFHGMHHYLYPVDNPGTRILLCNTDMEVAPGESFSGLYRLEPDPEKITPGQYYLALVEVNYNREIYCDRSQVYTVKNLADMSFDDGRLVYMVKGADEVTITGPVNGELLTGEVVVPAEVTNGGITYRVADVELPWNKIVNTAEVTRFNFQAPIAKLNGGGLTSKWAKLQSLTIGEGVKELEANAFYGCTALVELTLPSTLESIGQSAFYNCNLLESLSMSHAQVKTIGPRAFYGCKALTRLELPDALTTIGDYGFNNCNKLEAVVFGSGLKEIGVYAFGYCSVLKEIILPPATEVLRQSAFYSCKAATVIRMGEGVRSIGRSAFGMASAVTELVIPRSVRELGEMAFSGCSSLKTLRIEAELDTIRPSSFSSCSKLEWLQICEGVKAIQDKAFYGCSKLSYIDLPSTLDKMGADVFYRMSFGGASSIEVVSRAVEPPVIETNTFGSYIYKNAVLKVLPESFAMFSGDTDGWAQFVNIEGDRTTGIDSVDVDGGDVVVSFPADVYDVSGRLVVRGASQPILEELSPGLYIVGGRKIVIR